MTQKDLYLGPDFSKQPSTPVSLETYNVEEQLAGFEKRKEVKVEVKKQNKHQTPPSQTLSAGLQSYDM